MNSRVLDNPRDIMDIIQSCDVCYVSMVDAENKPYSIPMNFGVVENSIILHCAKEGKKIDLLKQNPNVCLVFSTDHELRWRNKEVACSWSMKYRSVLAFGKVEFVDEIAEKEALLHQFMKSYSPDAFKLNKPSLIEVQVLKVPVEKFEGRAYGY